MKKLKTDFCLQMPLLVAERTLLLVISFIILFSGAQQIEPKLERCKDVSKHRLTEGRKERAVDMYTTIQTYSLEGVFCCDSEAQTPSLDRRFILGSFRFSLPIN